jgi:hypothetical protein
MDLARPGLLESQERPIPSRRASIYESTGTPMKPLLAPWATWWQDDLPCRFSHDDAIRNRDFLVDLIGEGWLRKALQRHSSNHPLVLCWMTNRADAFLLLNALAEDARLLTSVPGFDQVLRDLKNGSQCLFSWHVIRAAAMFQRGGAVVSKFYEQNGGSAPDFLVKLGPSDVNVEAKLLLSDLDSTFSKYASPLFEKDLH